MNLTDVIVAIMSAWTLGLIGGYLITLLLNFIASVFN